MSSREQHRKKIKISGYSDKKKQGLLWRKAKIIKRQLDRPIYDPRLSFYEDMRKEMEHELRTRRSVPPDIETFSENMMQHLDEILGQDFESPTYQERLITEILRYNANRATPWNIKKLAAWLHMYFDKDE